MATTPTITAQVRFLSLLKHSILKLDLAELDFGIYRILNYRRTQILGFLDDTLPARVKVWTGALAQSSGRQLADSEADNCYYHLHTFFARYWDEGDAQMRFVIESADIAQDNAKGAAKNFFPQALLAG